MYIDTSFSIWPAECTKKFMQFQITSLGFCSCDLFCPNKIIIESVHSISRDERGFPLIQYITNGGLSRGRYIITHFKHNHRVLCLISNRMIV